MKTAGQDEAPWLSGEPPSILVRDSTGVYPFMPGMMVHSLLRRGLPFAEAFAVAEEVRRRLIGRSEVERGELAVTVGQILGRNPWSDEPDASAEIAVTGTEDRLPFSKGLLSQSLLATAMDASDAFAVAREIEHELIASGAREISRRNLRAMAARVLRRRAGREIAESYLLWRRYQEPERPVILLLGGTAGVGKTSLALEVARRLGIGHMLSTDSIRQVMRIMLSPDFVPAIHGSSYDAYKLLPREAGRSPSVIDGFRAQASAVSVGVRASFDRTIAESANLVVDGVSLVPGAIDIEPYRDRAEVIFLLVAVLDKATLQNRFAARATGQRRRMSHRYLESIDGILQIQHHLLELADRHGVPVVDNVSFDASVREIIGRVMSFLRGQEALRKANAGH